MDIQELAPLLALSEKELREKLAAVKGEYLVIADPVVVDFEDLTAPGVYSKLDAELWPAQLIGRCEYPILVFKLT